MAYLLDFIELTSCNKQTRELMEKNETTKPITMKSLLTLIVSAMFLATTAAHAAIVWGAFADTPTTLSGSAVWNSPPPNESGVLNTPNWSVSLDFLRTVKSASVTLNGVHLTAPHPGDTAPGADIELGLIIPISHASGSSDGTIYHDRKMVGHPTPGLIPPFGMHYDTWD
jgi:hypothetical protein